jgi:O-antigen/teichoic acid export membrane protein
MTGHLQLKQKMAQGALFLMLRQVLMQGLNIAGSILLARILTPAEFGLFAIFIFFLAFLTAFGDVGLAASLVREESEPQNSDYSVVFSFQFLLVTAASILFLLLAPALSAGYDLGDEAINAFRTLALVLWTTSFMVVPMVRLERSLAFKQIAAIEIVQAIVFNSVAVSMAWYGYGVWSFAIGLFSRTIVGVILANAYAAWRPRWLWSWGLISNRVAFGLHYQGVKFISLVKDSVTPVIIGFALGTTSVGYVNWAGMVAAYPVMALFVLQRLYLPAFARMQTDRAALGRLVEGVIWLTNSLAAPLAVVTLVFSVPLTKHVFGEQWMLALPLLYWFWAANLFVATTTPAMSLLDAVGLSRVNFKFSVIWMLGNWFVGIPLLLAFGLTGYAAANLLVQLTNILIYRAAQEVAPFKILNTIMPAWISASIIGLLSWVALFFSPVAGAWELAAHILVALVAYTVLMLLVQRSRIEAGLSLIRG